MNLIKQFLRDTVSNGQRWLFKRWNQWNYRMAKAEAMSMAEQYHRKYYVIQSSPVHWAVFSSADVRMLKKKGVFKKDLTWKEMTEKSAFVAIPK